MRPLVKTALLAPTFLLASCATMSPADICSAEWIGPRIDRAVGAIESDTSRLMRSVKKVGESYARGKTPGPLTLLSLSRSLNSLKSELTDGRGIRDLRTLSSTCNDPALVRDGLTTWLDRQDLPDQLMSIIDNFDLIDSLVEIDAS